MQEKVTVNYAEALAAFQKAGVSKGDTLLFHSSIKSIGWIDGGADAIADALCQAVGTEGTLVAPTFTFARPPAPVPVVDPDIDRCDTGAINASVLKRPDARRSLAMAHSFAVVGKHQAEICEIPPEICPLGDDGPFGKLMDLDAKILLIGVAYTHCTAGHYAEYLCQVPYRETIIQPAMVKMADGTLRDVKLNLYVPKNGVPYPPRDFIRAGNLLEERGKVSVSTLGNAYIRLFRLRDWVSLVQEKWREGDNVLSWGPGQTENSVCKDGHTVEIWFTNAIGNGDHTVRSVVEITPEANRQ